VAEDKLRALIGGTEGLSEVQIGRTERISSGFYTSQAMELIRR
jgi:magnesium-protoporphyrin O-methyltransferase